MGWVSDRLPADTVNGVTTHLAHISDPHIVERGELLGGIVDSATNLRAALHHIERMAAPVDGVVVTGDLTNDGRREQYEHFVELMSTLTVPWHAILGNHDVIGAADTADGALGAHVIHGGPRCGSGVLVIGDVNVVGLTSARHADAGGTLDPIDTDWLDRTLSGLTGPTLVAVHHPPTAVGLESMDTMRLDPGSADALAAVVTRHRVDAVICGHLHRMTVTPYAGTIAISAPSVAFSVALDLAEGATLAGSAEPPAMLVHRFSDGVLTTHHSIIGTFATAALE